MTDAELNTLSTPPSQDKGEALAEELERLREEVDRFRRPRDRALSTEDPITPLDSFQPRHLLGLALLFRQWCDSDLWGRPEEAELAARQVETAYSILTALSTAQASEREQIVAWLRASGHSDPGAFAQRAYATALADAIERGDYLATPVEPSLMDVERVALLALLQHQRAKVPDTQQSRHSVKGLDAAIAALQSPPIEQPAPAEARAALSTKEEGLVEELATLDVFLAAYAHHSDGEVMASVIDPTDDLLTLGQLRRILAALKARTSPETEASEAVVEHIAAILEEWDMKQPPDPFTGHDYRDIARDILARIDAHLSNTPGKESRDG